MQLIAVCILVVVVYVLGVFLFPDFWDHYTNPELNASIRDFKEQSLLFSRPH